MAKRGPADTKTGYRAIAGGIEANSYMRGVGRNGRVIRFDPRSTKQADETRSMVNNKYDVNERRAKHHRDTSMPAE